MTRNEATFYCMRCTGGRTFKDHVIHMQEKHQKMQEVKKDMKIPVEESQSLEDGSHEGVIEKVEYREDPFKYTDVYIKEEKTGFSLKYGSPTKITDKTKLGALMAKFFPLKVGEDLDPDDLVGKKVKFMTITEKAKDGNGEFNRIVDNSIKPLEENTP